MSETQNVELSLDFLLNALDIEFNDRKSLRRSINGKNISEKKRMELQTKILSLVNDCLKRMREEPLSFYYVNKELPLTNVFAWWKDLVGSTNWEEFFRILKPQFPETMKRNFNRWKLGKSIPTISYLNSLVNQELEYKGTIYFEGHLSPMEKIETIKRFLNSKQLSYKVLASKLGHGLIRLSTDEIKFILKKEGNERNDRKEFAAQILINKIQERYSKPSLEQLRNRLLTARSLQYITLRVESCES